MKPYESTSFPLYFEAFGEKFKEDPAEVFFQKTEDGEISVTKESNELMDALIGGNIISEEEYLTK